METLTPPNLSEIPEKTKKPKNSGKVNHSEHQNHSNAPEHLEHLSHSELQNHPSVQNHPHAQNHQKHKAHSSHLSAPEPQDLGEWPCLPGHLEISTMPILRSNQPVGILTLHIKHLPSGIEVGRTIIKNYSNTLVLLLKELKEKIS